MPARVTYELSGNTLIEQLEELSSGILIQGVGELGNGRGDLQAALKDDLLPLKTNILRPLYEPGEVRSGLNVLAWETRGSGTETFAEWRALTDTKVLRGGFK